LGEPLAAILTRIASGVFAPMIFGWPYRWPPTLAVPAIHCFARTLLGKSDFVSEAFSCFADHFRARRRGELYAPHTKPPRNFHNPKIGYPPPRASVGGQSEFTVNNAVDKLIRFGEGT
jgi:hypothetical protein